MYYCWAEIPLRKQKAIVCVLDSYRAALRRSRDCVHCDYYNILAHAL